MKKLNLSLRKQLVIIFIFAAFIPMTFAAALLYKSQYTRTLEKELSTQSQILKLAASNILQKVSYFNRLTASVYYNDEILRCLENGVTRPLTWQEKQQVQPAVDSMMRTDEMILSFSLLTVSGDTLFWNDGYSGVLSSNMIEPDFLKKIYEYNGQGVLSDPITYTKRRRYPSSSTSIYYGRLLRSVERSFRPIGLLIMEIDISTFEDIITSTGFNTDAALLLTTQNGTLVWGYQEELINFRIGDIIPKEIAGRAENKFSTLHIGGSDYYCFYSEVGTLEYGCYSFLPASAIQESVQSVSLFIFLIFMVNFVCLVLVFMMFTWKIITPVRALSVIMKDQDFMHYHPVPPLTAHNEIGNLFYAFHEMSQRTFTLVEQLKELSKKEASQQLALLHAQLNPHFLYNTLDAISWMSQNGHSEKIPDTVSALSNILRYSIIRNTDFVTISDELFWLKNYVYIQKIRFPDLFTVDYDVPQEARNCKIPRFILQPFIENSILHGFSEKSSGGRIILKIFLREKRIFITVTDNGKGMSKSSIYSALYRETNHIGIYNTNEYIRKKFGSSFGVYIESKQNQGTTVTVCLPFQK